MNLVQRSHAQTLRWQSPAVIALVCLLFGAPFVMLAVRYSAAPSPLPVLRSSLSHTALWATKSLFMVFRVPLMNLIHGLMAAVMLSRSSDFRDVRRSSYSRTFLILLFTVALKSDLEAMEFVAATVRALQPCQFWIGVGTLACVIGGLALALIASRKVPLPWPELRLTMRNKVALAGLFASYVAVVIVSIARGHRG